MSRRPRAERKERKPREARAPRVIANKGAVVFSILRNSGGDIGAATQHQVKRVSDGSSEIDPSRSHRNRNIVGSGNIRADVLEYEKTICVGWHARDSAQPYLTLVLSASPEFFRPAGGPPGSEIDAPEDAARLEEWIAASTDWSSETFGQDLVSVIYNGDETTPHLHLCVVPTFERREKQRPKLRRGEGPEEHAKRVKAWEEECPRIRTRAWASNPVVGRYNSADLLRREYAGAMAPFGLEYSLESYDKADPDDPVSAREFRDAEKAAATKARKEAEARAEAAEAERAKATIAREEAEARAAAAEAELEAARATREAEDARRARFREEATRALAKKKAALASERAAVEAERAKAAEEKAAVEAERDALRADGAVLEAVVSGLEGGTLTHTSTTEWTRSNDNVLKAAPTMWQRIMPFVRSLLRKQEEAEGAHRESLGLIERVRAWLRRPDLSDEARASAPINDENELPEPTPWRSRMTNIDLIRKRTLEASKLIGLEEQAARRHASMLNIAIAISPLEGLSHIMLAVCAAGYEKRDARQIASAIATFVLETGDPWDIRNAIAGKPNARLKLSVAEPTPPKVMVRNRLIAKCMARPDEARSVKKKDGDSGSRGDDGRDFRPPTEIDLDLPDSPF